MIALEAAQILSVVTKSVLLVFCLVEIGHLVFGIVPPGLKKK